MVIVIHYAEVKMKEFTRNELRRLSRLERESGNFPLANFLERVGKGELSVVVVNDGLVKLAGLPPDIHCLYIDDESIKEADGADDEHIQTLLGIFGKKLDDNATWGEARDAIYSAVKQWANAVPQIPTSEEAKHIYGVSITIPGWDYKAIEKAIKKKTYVQGVDYRRSYGQEVTLANDTVAEVRFFPPYVPIDDLDFYKEAKFHWRIMGDKGAWLHKVDNLQPIEITTPIGVFVCQLEPDLGYE
jgi:hypothetical protein